VVERPATTDCRQLSDRLVKTLGLATPPVALRVVQADALPVHAAAGGHRRLALERAARSNDKMAQHYRGQKANPHHVATRCRRADILRQRAVNAVEERYPQPFG
jgi:hypothetical protein